MMGMRLADAVLQSGNFRFLFGMWVITLPRLWIKGLRCFMDVVSKLNVSVLFKYKTRLGA